MWGRKKQRRGSTRETLRHEKHMAEFADAKWKKSGSACQCFQKLFDFIDVELRSWLMLIINDWQLGQQLNISEHPSTCPTRRGFGRSSNAGACNTCNRVLRPDSAQPKWLPLVVLWQSYGSPMVSCDWGTLEHGKAKPLVSTCFHTQNSLYIYTGWWLEIPNDALLIRCRQSQADDREIRRDANHVVRRCATFSRHSIVASCSKLLSSSKLPINDWVVFMSAYVNICQHISTCWQCYA